MQLPAVIQQKVGWEDTTLSSSTSFNGSLTMHLWLSPKVKKTMKGEQFRERRQPHSITKDTTE